MKEKKSRERKKGLSELFSWETGGSLGWGSGGLNSVRSLFSLRQRDRNLFGSRLLRWERGMETVEKTKRNTGVQREQEKQDTKKKKWEESETDKRNRWVTDKGKTEVEWESTPGSNTRSLGRLYSSATVQYTLRQQACPNTEPPLPCTWWLRRDLTALLSSHSHYRPGSSWHGRSVTTQASDGVCLQEVSNGTFHHAVPEMTPTERNVDALISAPRC